MNTTWLYILIAVVIVIQVGLLIWGRKIRKRARENDVLVKYNINTRQDAWKVLSNPDLPDDDREKLEALYNAE